MRRISTLCTVLALGSSVVAGEPCQVARLVAPGPYAATSFGNSIARSGDYWFIADYRAQVLCTGFGCGAGAVYVYEMVDGELVYVQTLLSIIPQVPDNYGASIDADDDLLVIGAPFSGLPGRGDRPGAVFVYSRVGDEWRLTSIIEPPVGTERFGELLSLSDGTLAVADRDRARVLIYEIDSMNWELTDELLPPPEVSAESAFGTSLQVMDSRVVVGAPRDRSRLPVGGSFHVYQKQATGGYALEHSEFSNERQQLGSSLAIEGDTLFAGAFSATRAFEQQGVVYRYRFDGEQWVVVEELAGEPATARQGFGAKLRFVGDRLAVTATPQDAVYLFERASDGRWIQQSRVRAETPTDPDFFGYAVEMDGETLVVGAFDESDTFGSPPYGAAYHFDLTCNPCPPDLDADGALTVFDYLTFLNLFQDGDAQADFDGDGELTVFDFLAFQTVFDAGCE